MCECVRCGAEDNHDRFTIMAIPVCEACVGLILAEYLIRHSEFMELMQAS